MANISTMFPQYIKNKISQHLFDDIIYHIHNNNIIGYNNYVTEFKNRIHDITNKTIKDNKRGEFVETLYFLSLCAVLIGNLDFIKHVYGDHEWPDVFSVLLKNAVANNKMDIAEYCKNKIDEIVKLKKLPGFDPNMDVYNGANPFLVTNEYIYISILNREMNDNGFVMVTI